MQLKKQQDQIEEESLTDEELAEWQDDGGLDREIEWPVYEEAKGG